MQKAEESGVPVWQILRDLVSDQKTPEALAQNIARLLPEIKDPRAEDLTAIVRARRGQMQPIAIKHARLPDFSDKDWEGILRRIDGQRCTPLIGPGASAGTSPPMAEIARHLALEYAYPFGDSDNLARVAQYVATIGDVMTPKEAFAEHYASIATPNFSELPNEPHRVLADLPFPVYLTSNFDDWMYRALTEYKKRDARLAICRWNRHIPENAPSFDPEFAYSVENPLVYHFHGCTPWAESAVVTEDDYFEFLINISRDYKLLAHRVDRALAGAIMFVGVNPLSVMAQVLFSIFSNRLRDSGSTHVMQVMPTEHPESEAKYLTTYLGNRRIRSYFGTSEEFLTELQKRWEAFKQ